MPVPDMAVPGPNPPVIVLTAAYEAERRVSALGLDYSGAVEEVGGLAWIAPVPLRLREGARREADRLAAAAASGILDRGDGLLLTGGPDLDPETFGEDPIPGLGMVDDPRDRFELALARDALSRGLPVLGICRGAQVLAVAAGGTLYQDLASQRPGCLKHHQRAARSTATHYVSIDPDSLLFRLLEVTRLKVNSFHHQAVSGLPPGFAASALAPDGVIEALEPSPAGGPAGPDRLRGPAGSGPGRGGLQGWALGVQWHPENMWATEPVFLRLFTGLVEAARSERAGRTHVREEAVSDD